ncbi:DUF2391 family protein [Thermococcus profundus]
MSESNTEGMMSPEPERGIQEKDERVEKLLEELVDEVESLKSGMTREKIPDKLGWDDVTQELIGAVTFALPFLFTGELWDVAKDISIERSLTIFIMTLGIAYLFLTKSRIGNIRKEELFHIPKRLFTVAGISYTASALLIYLYGINSVAHFNTVQYLNATVLISTFAVIGAITVDMVK